MAVLPELAGHGDISVIQQVHTDAGAPDFKVSRPGRPPLGFIEAKPRDNDLRHKSGHDKDQFERYSDLPNWIYTNFWELHLYNRGEMVEKAVLAPREALETSSDVETELRRHDLAPAVDILRRFVGIEPPAMANAGQVAGWLAAAARLVRRAVRETLRLPADTVRPLIDIRDEFREVLFAQMDEPEEDFDGAFSDAYAQTLAYGLLLARIESGAELTLATADDLIDKAHHPLLRATVRLLAEDEILDLVGWSLEVLVDITNAVDPSVLSGGEDRDPVLYFYEDFLAAYDPELRKKRGVYYTPPSVVRYQVKAIHSLLKSKFGASEGLLSNRVHVLDPAVGTGTYLIACLEEAAAEAGSIWGPGAVAEAVSDMLDRLYGFELLVGPYAVAHYRLQAAATALGSPPKGRLQIYLTDTLAQSRASPAYTPRFAYLSQPLTEEREGADRVKSETPILVVLGNPPYDRTTALQNEWLYHDLLDDFREPVREAGLGVHLKSLSDPFVYFYRWALWRLFEGEGAVGEGILSFITNRTWLRGEAFGGLRREIRARFCEGWVFDLHGDLKAALPAGIEHDENVFDIMAGVAIGVFYRAGATSEDAEVWYTEAFGTREQKEALLDQGFAAQEWKATAGAGIDALLPSLAEEFYGWPDLREIFVFSKSGVKTERDALVVGLSREAVVDRIRGFFALPQERQVLEFHESGGRTVAKIRRHGVVGGLVRRIMYRFLDQRYLYNDPDFVSRYGPEVQATWGDNNIGLYAMASRTGYGPAAVAVGELPDYHAFRGSYGGYVFPLYDRRLVSAEGAPLDPSEQSNVRPALVQALREVLGLEIGPEEVFCFIYGVLACEQYSLRFSGELQREFPHVPIPKDAQLFEKGVGLGNRLARLHTFQEVRPATALARIYGELGTIVSPAYTEEARLLICKTAWVEPVSDEAWSYSVSGYPVLRRWIEHRTGLMLSRRLVQELLHIIHIIEETVALRPMLAEFVETVLDGDTFSAVELGVRES